MLISHKHKFVTIDMPKTGTRSLRTTLDGAGVVDVIGAPYNSNSVLKQHASIQDCIKGFRERGWNIDEYYKYTVVRNPWDRYFSFYTYYKMKAQEFLSNSPEELTDMQIKQGELAVELFNNKTDTQTLKYIIHGQPSQLSYLQDKKHNIPFNRIALFENLSEEFESFCKDVNIGHLELGHENKSNEGRLSKGDVFVQGIVDMIAEKEKWVIDEFGYNYSI